MSWVLDLIEDWAIASIPDEDVFTAINWSVDEMDVREAQDMGDGSTLPDRGKE